MHLDNSTPDLTPQERLEVWGHVDRYREFTRYLAL